MLGDFMRDIMDVRSQSPTVTKLTEVSCEENNHYRYISSIYETVKYPAMVLLPLSIGLSVGYYFGTKGGDQDLIINLLHKFKHSTAYEASMGSHYYLAKEYLYLASTSMSADYFGKFLSNSVSAFSYIVPSIYHELVEYIDGLGHKQLSLMDKAYMGFNNFFTPTQVVQKPGVFDGMLGSIADLFTINNTTTVAVIVYEQPSFIDNISMALANLFVSEPEETIIIIEEVSENTSCFDAVLKMFS